MKVSLVEANWTFTRRSLAGMLKIITANFVLENEDDRKAAHESTAK